MIIVTGGAGFIGSNLVKGLNQIGIDNILIVDDLSDGSKINNLSDCLFSDYMDKDEFLSVLNKGLFSDMHIDAVFHQGACSDTMELDGQYMMQINYSYSKALFHFCLKNDIPFIYASSASVYGSNQAFEENAQNECPINPYAFSKWAFDMHVRKHMEQASSQIIGMRYFNVFGPRENHKGRMASVIFHFNDQLKKQGKVKLFKGSGGYGDGEQRRDFIYVNDVVKFNLWCLEHPDKSGIVNVGTGQAASFNEVAQAVINWHSKGEIEYIPFPESLAVRYQHFTQADTHMMREQLGYTNTMTSLGEGVSQYLDWLNQSPS